MVALRNPVGGCPWDIKQTFATIAPYTIEEAYEVADAIERNDLTDLKDELGDLLLQVVYHARMAEELGSFDFGDVVKAITTKLIRRHPHVFDKSRVLTPEEVKGLWNEIKAAERAEKREEKLKAGIEPEYAPSLLDGIPAHLPALSRAEKLQSRASTVGFDWNNAELVLDKIREEIGEIEEAIKGGRQEEIVDEVGDLLFAVANLARHLHVDPEAGLRGTNLKFTLRFKYIEENLTAKGRSLEEATLDEMEALWIEAKTKAQAKAKAKG
jgi:ATP diphosphatase